MNRRVVASTVAAIALLVSATPVLGLLVWTLTGGPLTATVGTATTFTLTATNLDVLSELGCLEVDLPASFTIVDAHAGNASNGDEWEAVVFDGKVAVHSLSGGGRLEVTQSITFTVTAVPTVAGAYLWPNHAHSRQDCAEAEEVGVALSVVVLPALLATPAPTPTPRPTTAPTPTPTAAPATPSAPAAPGQPADTPRPSAPAAAPVTPRATPRPTASATPSVGAVSQGTPSASPSPTPSPVTSAGATGTGAAQASPAPSGLGPSQDARPARFIQVVRPDESDDGTLLSLGLPGIDGLGVWIIPGAVVGGPGLLVIVWVAIQTGVAAAWIPAVRRMRGADPATPQWPSGQGA